MKKSNAINLEKSFISDQRLSWTARGLLAYIYSTGKEEFDVDELAKKGKAYRGEVIVALNKLTELGYLNSEGECSIEAESKLLFNINR